MGLGRGSSGHSVGPGGIARDSSEPESEPEPETIGDLSVRNLLRNLQNGKIKWMVSYTLVFSVLPFSSHTHIPAATQYSILLFSS